jgi:imidazolonepropionase-like amidohydrolase
MRLNIFLGFVTFLTVLSASAQLNTSNASPLSQTITLKAASYVDTQQGKLIRPAVIVIDQGRITGINPEMLPVDSTVVDLGDATLLPGLIDAHTHLMISTNDTPELVRQARSYSESEFVLVAMKNGYKNLMAGFTTIRDLDGWYFIDVTLSRNSEEDGFTLPRIVPAGHGINVSSPSDFSHIFTTDKPLPHVGIADTRQELMEAVDHQAAMGAGVIKFYGTAGFTMSEYSDRPVGAQTYTDEDVAAVVTRAREHGLKVATHAHGSDGILASVRAGVASIEHGSLLTDEIIEEMKARGTYLVPTTNIMNMASLDDPHSPPKALAVIRSAIGSHKRAIKAGVNIAYGTDAGLYPHGNNADGFQDLVDYGMSPAQAIQTATVNAADLLGVEDRGSIEIGKLADIIAVKGNPLQDVSLLQNVSFVMKNGTVYKMAR